MIDFKIKRGLSTTMFTAPGVVNPRLIIEEGYWYLCVDTADLYLGINDNGTLKLKRINGERTAGDVETNYIVKAEINKNGELVVYFSNGTSESLGKVISETETDEVVNIKIGDVVYTPNAEGVIELPEFVTKSYVDEKFDNLAFPEIPTKLSEFQNDMGFITKIPNNYVTTERYNAFSRHIKYEVLPHEGILVDYKDSEIRINTARVKPSAQQTGSTATPNQYYIPFRAYAPEGAVAFKEWQGNSRDETLHTFNESFSGTDSFGRNYSLIWMSVASFDGKNWNLYGDRSTTEKYLGFYYTFEWYGEQDKLLDTDTVRIILTNDSCHNDLVPDAIARRIDDKIASLDLPEGGGEDGFSPIIETRPIENGYELIITTKTGTETLKIFNGQDSNVSDDLIRDTVLDVLDDTLDTSINEKLQQAIPQVLETLILHGGSAASEY